METNDSFQKMVPPNVRGKASNTVVKVELPTLEEALEFFLNAKRLLCDINRWSSYSSIKLATTSLTDENGNVINHFPKAGNYIRTDLIGPGSAEGGGYDWVQIIAVDDVSNAAKEEEMFSFKVRPATNPLNPGSVEIAHFFTGDATNTFIIKRVKNTVTGSVNGRNEVANIQAKNKKDKIRNAAFSAASAIGFSNLEWKLLLDGIFRLAKVC